MKKDRSTSLYNLPFFVLAFFMMTATAALYLIYPENDVFHMLNIEHTEFLDRMFTFLSTFGDGTYLFLVGCVIIILYRDNIKTNLLKIVTSYALSAIIVQILKNIIWPKVPRPSRVISPENLQLVEEVVLSGFKSFPSGHTATAIAVLFVLSSFSNTRYKVLAAVLGFLIGYSRLYLNQHFPIDIAASSGIGILVGYVVCRWVQPQSKEERSSEVHETAVA